MRRGLGIWIALVLGVLTGWTWERVGDCETGWEWSRRSVRCVQSNCNSVEHAHYGHDGSCVCSTSGSIAEKTTDPTKECHRAASDKSCPRCVYACVKQTESCPGAKPKPDPKKACEKKCTEYHSPGVRAKYAGGKCTCVCKDGYEPDETLTCRKISPQKACENECTEYHSPGVKAQYASGECKCVCKKGYAPDETLTCKKVECADQCKDELGPLAEAKGTHPDCKCGCKDGFEPVGDKCLPPLDPSVPSTPDEPDLPAPREPPKLQCPPGASPDPSGDKCECGPGFLPEPKDGKCVKPAGCGDDTCDPDGDETCVSCPEDCGCTEEEFCTGPEDDLSKAKCRIKRATFVTSGCGSGDGTAGVSIVRDGERLTPVAGLILTDGDRVRLSNFDLRGCKNAYLTLDWGGTLGRVILGEDFWYEFEIKGGSWRSGWPVARNNATEAASAVVTFVRDQGIGAALTFAFGKMLGGVMGAASPGGIANRRVWIKSYVVIHQRTDGSVRVYTKEGHPEVAFGEGPRVAVGAGMAVDFDADGTIASPMKYDPAELAALGEEAVPWCGKGQHREGAKCVDDDAPSDDQSPKVGPTEPKAKTSRLPAVIGWIAIGLIAISVLGFVVTLVRRRGD